MLRNRWLLASGACLLATALCATLGCDPVPQVRAAQLQPPVSVASEQVRSGTLARTITLTGTLRAAREAQVASDASGVLIGTEAGRGDRVLQGSVLARLDARGAKLALDEASAQSASARAQRTQAERECARAARLRAEGAMTQAEQERFKHQCEVARDSLQAAELRAASAKKRWSDAVVRAPFAGRVVERFVDIGDYVQSARPLFHLVDDARLRLELSVPETESMTIAEGATVAFHVPAHSGRAFEARVTRLSPALRERTRELPVEAEADNADGSLRAGMFAVARLVVGTQELPTIPESALVEQAGVQQVYVLTESRLEQRLVRTGPRQAGRVGILDGLSLGERVVTRITPAVRDGVRVH